MNCKSPQNPIREYFNEEKFNLWLNMCDVVQDLNDKIGDLVLNGYLTDVNRLVLEKLVGKLRRLK